jgi:hypothetical protein
MAKRGRPPTPKGQGLETEIKIRVRKDEKAAYDIAAKLVPTSLSNWARIHLNGAALQKEKKGR